MRRWEIGIAQFQKIVQVTLDEEDRTLSTLAESPYQIVGHLFQCSNSLSHFSFQTLSQLFEIRWQSCGPFVLSSLHL